MARTVHLHLDDHDQRRRDDEVFADWLEENECLIRPDVAPDYEVVTESDMVEMFGDD